MKRLVALVAVAAAVSLHAPAAQATGPTAQDVSVATSPDPVEVSSLTVPKATASAKKAAPSTLDEEQGDLVAEMPARGTDDYAMVGVTWSQTAGVGDLTVEVRLRRDGAWSSWKDLEVDHESTEGGRPGTEPLWVGRADGVSVRVQSTQGIKPADLKVVTIDPGDPVDVQAQAAPASYDPLNDSSTTIQAADGKPRFTPRPTIITRSAWKAAAGGKCDSPRVGETTKGAVVHHTAGTNSYSKSQSAGIVRSTQAYHIKSRKWCDIGYNFLVDKYGQIFEGRKGGMDRTVRAAHSGNGSVNTYTMGVSMMGNFDTANVGTAMRNSMVKLIGWRFGTTYLKARGTYRIGGKTLNRIAGHRNVVSTACPGKYGYAWLSAKNGLRIRVEAYISKYASQIKSYVSKLGGLSVTGPVYIGEYGNDTKRRALFRNYDILWKQGVGVFHVMSYIRTEYNRLGAHTGELRFPTGVQVRTSRPDVLSQRFERGTIYRLKSGSSYKTSALWGPIASYYLEEEDEAKGRFGAPVKGIYKLASGPVRAEFEKGWITYSSAKGIVLQFK